MIENLEYSQTEAMSGHCTKVSHEPKRRGSREKVDEIKGTRIRGDGSYLFI